MNALQEFQEPIAIVLVYWILYSLHKLIKTSFNVIDNRIKESREYDEKQAFKLYVETGKKNTTFYHLDRSVTHAAKRERKVRIKEKAKFNSEFSAFCQCPDCESYDIHYIKPVNLLGIQKVPFLSGCLRECKQCSFTWRQI